MLPLQEIALRLTIASVLAGIIGIERELRKAFAGLRTHMLVSLSACLITIVSLYFFQMDPARIAAGIIIGVGFIGGGTVMATKDKILGLTTAASLWFISSLGIIIGIGQYLIGLVAVLIALLILEMKRVERWLGKKKK